MDGTPKVWADRDSLGVGWGGPKACCCCCSMWHARCKPEPNLLTVIRVEGLEKLIAHQATPGEKRHINIKFLLWLTSRWRWDKRLVVPGLTGPKSLCVRLEHRKYKLFSLVYRRVVPALSRLSPQFMCSKFMCLFLALATPLRFRKILACTHKNRQTAKGPAERGHVKKRQKSSKSVKHFWTCFDKFRAG